MWRLSSSWQQCFAARAQDTAQEVQAQRVRVAQTLDAPVVRVRARLREHTDDLLFEP